MKRLSRWRIGTLACVVAVASILAIDLQLSGHEQSAASPHPIPPPPEKVWALIVGVSNYTHAEPLQYAASDALAFADFLKSPRGGSFPDDHVFVLTEDKATRAGVLVAIESLQDRVQPGDTVHIYISGHGYVRNNVGYFIPSDGHLSSASLSAISFAHLKDMTEAGLAKAGVRVLITDFCYSGRIGTEQSQLAQRIQQLIYEEFLRLKREPGTFLNLLASRPMELSWEKDTGGQGIFTFALLEGLNGKAARAANVVVDAGGLVDYLTSEVPKQTANQQHPIANRDFDPAMPLAFLDRPGAPAKAADQRAILLILNTGSTIYSRVEWTDPATQVTAVRPLSREANDAMISVGVPGNIELRFYDPQDQVRKVRVSLDSGNNTLDILTADLRSYRFIPAGPIRIAALQPVIPQVTAQFAEQPEAILIVNLDRPTNVYVDGTLWGANRAGERQLQLRGLIPGTHNLTLIPDPNREFRFRLQLFAGTQIFDPESGELLFMGGERPSSLETASLQAVPAALQATYQRFVFALQEERLIQPAGDSAWDYYIQLRDALPAALQESIKNRLIIAMGDRAQRTILKYLRGGDLRWNAEMFSQAAALLERTQQLFREGGVFESQRIFLNGRALLERGQYAQAVEELRRAVALDPEASYAHNAIGLAFWKQNMFDQAIPQLQQALSITPQWNYPRNTLALIYLEQRRFNDCEETFATSILTNPEDSTAYHGLAQLYLLQGRPQDAETQLRRAIEFNPGNAYAYETYGKLYQARRDFTQAEGAFRLAIRLEPAEPSFRVSLNELLRETGRVAESQAGLAQLARTYRSDLRVVQSYASLLAQQNRIGEAKTLFERAAKSAPSDSNLRIAYAGFMRQHGRTKDAQKQIEAALRLVPNNAFARYELASIFLIKRQTSKAESELVRAMASDAGFAAPRRLLGQIRFLQMRYSEALDEYRKGLQISTDPIQQEELQQYIKEAETKLADSQLTEAKKSIDRRDYGKAWSIYSQALARVPASRSLRSAVLAFVEQHPGEGGQAGLPQPLSQVLETSFWKAGQRAEQLWMRNSTEQAVEEFSNALANLDPQERRVIAGTEFNLGNEEYSIHQIVYRWGRRFLDLGRHRGAVALMDHAIQLNIFGVVPDFSPLTLDSLMIPDNGLTPATFTDYEVAQHPDHRIHAIYAAGYAVLEDMEKARHYLTALEGSAMELSAVNVVAETLRMQQRWNEAIALLQERLASRAVNANHDATVQAYILLAGIQLEAGNRIAAKATMDTARKLFPKHRQINAARRKFRL